MTFYSDSSVSPALTYFYRVRAFTVDNFSDYSNEAVGALLVAAPTNLLATVASPTSNNLAWAENSNNELGFKIERSTLPDSGFTLLTTVGAGITAYTDSTAIANTTYYYRVRAYITDANSAYSNVASSTGPIIAGPTGLVVTSGCGDVVLTWTDNSTNEDGFVVEQKNTLAGPFAESLIKAKDSIGVKVTGLTGNSTYCFRLRAFHGTAVSAYSNESCNLVVPPAVKPGNVTVTPAEGSLTFTLDWEDNDTNETDYRIQYSLGGGAFTDFVLAPFLPADTTSYSAAIVAGDIGTEFKFKVGAENAICTPAFSGTISATYLGAPTGLSATAGAAASATITLSWTDNSANETKYEISRSTSANAAFSKIAEVNKNITSYSDSGLAIGTTYFYRVRAANSVAASAESNEDNKVAP